MSSIQNNHRIIPKAYHHKENDEIKDRRCNVNEDELKQILLDENIKKMVLKNAESVACIFKKASAEVQEFSDRNCIRFKNVENLKKELKEYFSVDHGANLKVDSNIRFLEEPSGGSSTAFFVGGKKNNVVCTAGHCVNGTKEALENIYFVFDYLLNGKNNFIFSEEGKYLEFPQANVYKFHKIIAKIYTDAPVFSNSPDWALVKVKPFSETEHSANVIHGREALKLKKDVKINVRAYTYMLGHPKGLPMKVAHGGSFTQENDQKFKLDIDGFSGNSGSPTFQNADIDVDGIFTGGPYDYSVGEQKIIHGNYFATWLFLEFLMHTEFGLLRMDNFRKVFSAQKQAERGCKKKNASFGRDVKETCRHHQKPILNVFLCNFFVHSFLLLK